MATYRNGPLGGFSGKVGPVVGATWRGKEVLRSMPEKSSKPPTQGQLLQRQKFKDVLGFLNPIMSLLATTFRTQTAYRNGFELAKSYHLKEAMQPSENGWDILYPKVLISAGDVRGMGNPSIHVEADQTLRLQWTDDSGQAMANATDKLLVVLYLPTLNQFEVFKDVGTRQDGNVTITYPSYYISLEAQSWATFGLANGSKYAVSTYLGAIML